MARPVSSLESHPQVNQIIDAIVAKTPYRLVAAQADPPVSTAAISRFASRIKSRTADTISQAKRAIANIDKGVTPEVEQAVTRAALTAAVDPFVARAMRSDERRERWMAAVEADADYRTLATLDRNDLAAQEYQARLAHRLDGSSTSLTVNVVCPAAPTVTPDEAVTIDITAGE
jgi:hypothetical protein